MGAGFRRVVALLFSWLHLVAVVASSTDLQPSNTGTGFLDRSEDEARKLFAGYRIVPKPCVGTPSSPNGHDGAPGICMFNYECSQRNGELVGACMDGFLFGACCKLPPGVSFVVDLPGIDDLDINGADNLEGAVTPSLPDSTHDLFLPPVVPSFPSAGADTVLLHQNGSEVKDSVQNLQELLFDRPNIQEEPSGPTSRRPELTTFSYVTGPGVLASTLKHSSTSKSPAFSTETSSSPPKPHGSMMSADNPSWENILQSNAILSDALEKSSSKKPYVTASTTYYTQPPQYTKPSFFTTTTKWHYGQPGFRPKPTTQSTKQPALSTEDGLIQVPLLLASSTNVPDSDANVEAATNAASINHIISILNNSQQGYYEGSQTPQRNATQKPVTKPAKYKPTTPGYTYLEPILIETTPSKEIPTAAASNVVTSQSYFTGKKPSTSTTLSIHYTSRPTTTTSTTTTRRPPSSTSTINIHGPSFTIKPKDPVRQTTPNPHVTHYSTPKPPSSYTKKPDPESSSHYRPTQDSSYHYTPSPTYDYLYSSSTNYPTPPPPPPSGLYGPPPSPTLSSLFSTALYTSATPSSSLRPPKPSAPPPVPTVIVLGPYDPVSTTYPSPTNKPTLSSHIQDSLIGNTGLVYTQIPSNNQGGHVTIITKKPSRPTSTTVTKRTPITVATQPITESPGSTDVFHFVTAYPPVVTLPTALPSENDLIAFPPVRDPNLNVTSKPSYTGEEDTEDAQYGSDYTTPHLDETNLDNKVHGFVNKIVQSLQGNFQDLEQVLFNGEKANITISKPIVFTTTTRRPTILSTLWSTNRPTRPTTKKPPPTKVPKPTTPVVPTTTKKPTTRPPPTTTKRPLSTTRRPKPSSTTTTTKKPKPPRKPSTTTESYIEDDESTSPYSSSTAGNTAEPDYRKQCGVRPHVKSGRVVGGKGATFGEWPWQVLVRESTWLGLFTKNKCGGVLITHRYVITAAHCQPGFLASLVAVFGEYDISGELEQKRSVSKNVRRVIVHRQYDAATFENDLALLELESPIQYDTHIVPICMPGDHADFTGRMATVTGWGRLKYGGGVPSVLQEVQVPVIENSVCQEMFHTSGHAKNIISSFLCAGYANGQKDSCEGDSGGPLMVEGEDGRWILVGTVSHGIKCAAPYLPGVYMRTTYYKPWLKSITGVQ